MAIAARSVTYRSHIYPLVFAAPDRKFTTFVRRLTTSVIVLLEFVFVRQLQKNPVYNRQIPEKNKQIWSNQGVETRAYPLFPVGLGISMSCRIKNFFRIIQYRRSLASGWGNILIQLSTQLIHSSETCILSNIAIRSRL